MKSKLGKLTAKEIEAITGKAGRSKKVPLFVSKTPQVELTSDLNTKIGVLSNAQGVPANKFILNLLKEDINRLWKVYRKAT